MTNSKNVKKKNLASLAHYSKSAFKKLKPGAKIASVTNFSKIKLKKLKSKLKTVYLTNKDRKNIKLILGASRVIAIKSGTLLVIYHLYSNIFIFIGMGLVKPVIIERMKQHNHMSLELNQKQFVFSITEMKVVSETLATIFSSFLTIVSFLLGKSYLIRSPNSNFSENLKYNTTKIFKRLKFLAKFILARAFELYVFSVISNIIGKFLFILLAVVVEGHCDMILLVDLTMLPKNQSKYLKYYGTIDHACYAVESLYTNIINVSIFLNVIIMTALLQRYYKFSIKRNPIVLENLRGGAAILLSRLEKRLELLLRSKLVYFQTDGKLLIQKTGKISLDIVKIIWISGLIRSAFSHSSTYNSWDYLEVKTEMPPLYKSANLPESFEISEEVVENFNLSAENLKKGLKANMENKILDRLDSKQSTVNLKVNEANQEFRTIIDENSSINPDLKMTPPPRKQKFNSIANLRANYSPEDRARFEFAPEISDHTPKISERIRINDSKGD